jgi:hypothetical protein
MGIGKAAIRFTLGTVFLLTGCGAAQSGQTTELNGSQLPGEQGWSVFSNAVTPYDVATNGSTLTLNTIGVLRKNDQLPSQQAVMWFYKEVPFDFDSGFSIEFTLKVHKVEKPHNLHDAGIMFYGSTIDPSDNFKRLQQELDARNQSAARSLAEGLEETLTLHRLGVFALVGLSFKTTNCLESINALVEERCAKVDRWTSSNQRQRWLATALLDIEFRLRKVKGYRHLPKLREALQRTLQLEMATTRNVA